MEVDNTILNLYNESGIKQMRKIDSSRKDSDKRCTVLVTYNDGISLAIKVTNNAFTTPERITGWRNLEITYLNAGIYCPQIINNVDGNYYCYVNIDSENCIIYAEEQKKYKCVDEFEKPIEYAVYGDKMIRTIGIIASYETKLVPWHSAYCLYDKFSEDDEMNENLECAQNICKLFRENTIGNEEIIDKIWNIYSELRTSFEPEYRALPCAVFQADMNETNVMLTEDEQFVGIIDFNVSGTETILNYALCESWTSPSWEKELDNLMNTETLIKANNELAHYMKIIKEHYSFTNAEVEAYPKLYHMIIPFRWPTFCLFRWAILEKKEEYYNDILQWMLYQLTRNDIDL